MKDIVIAAGYATRLGELTKNFPKPLLKIGENTILGRMLDDIDRIPEIDEHIIITNHKFAGIFEDWKKDLHYSKPITIVDDGTETNETRLGAVCDLLFAMDKLHIDDDLLVVAADNLLFFSFQEFVDFAKEKQTSCIMCHEQPSIEKLQRTGVVSWMKTIGCWAWRRNHRCQRATGLYHHSISIERKTSTWYVIQWRMVAARMLRAILLTIWWSIRPCMPGP